MSSSVVPAARRRRRRPAAPRRRLAAASLGSLSACALLALPSPAAAQPPPAPGTAAAPAAPPMAIPECLGFSFGAWTPPLDAAAAGHDPRARGGYPQAPDGRGWASEQITGRDSTLMLFPSWWPAGVVISFRVPATHADTLRGTATALVADGRLRAPVAPVLAWGVPCRRPPAAPAAGAPPRR